MKKLIGSYIFLLLYITAMFRPVMPVVDYLINYDYIAEQLCENRDKPILACNGICYVAKEIEKITPVLPTENKSRIPTIDFEKYPITTLFKCKYAALGFNILQKSKFAYSKVEKIEGFVEYVFRPPKNLV